MFMLQQPTLDVLGENDKLSLGSSKHVPWIKKNAASGDFD